MSTPYTRSIITHFSGSLNFDQFEHEIVKSTAITTVLDFIHVAGDTVSIWFLLPLSTAEEASLDTIISTLVPLATNTSEMYDAIVDSTSAGDYMNVSEAFADGHLSVLIRNGTYTEYEDIIIPDGGQLHGESQGNVRLILGTNSIKVDGSGGIQETAGTLGVENKSAVVTGTGTTFTNIVPGHYISVSSNFHQVASVTSDTVLTLTSPYFGATRTGLPFIAQPMFTGIKLENIILYSSSTIGLYIRGVRHCSFKSIAIMGCTANMQIIDSGDSAFYEVACGFSGVGILFQNCISIVSNAIDVYNCVTDGLIINDCKSNVFNSCSSSSNGGMGISILGATDDLILSETVLKDNHGNGIGAGSSTSNISVTACTSTHNGGFGIDASGTHSNVSSNNVGDNSGSGIQLGANSIATSNILVKNGDSGIVSTAGECQIASNKLENHVTGISLNGSTNVVTGNTITDSTTGIELGSTSDVTIINSNIVTRNTTGLNIVSGANDTLYSGNIFKTNATQIVDSGTGTISAPNILAA